MNQPATPRNEWNTGRDRGEGECALPFDNPSHLLRLLNERLQFESLLSRLSTTFINLPAEEVDSQIERGLHQIMEFLQIERSSVAQFSEDSSELLVTHSCTIPGFPPLPIANIAASLPWFTARIREGKVIRLRQLPDDLPAEAVAERQYCLQVGLRSQLTIPFQVGEAVLGGIGFGSFRQQRDWSDDLVQSLQLVGEIFANAQARKRADLARRESEGRFRRAEEALRESETRLRFLLESTHAIPWIADAETWQMTYIGPQAGRLLGYPPDVWYEKDFWPRHIHPEDREAAIAFCLEHSRGHSDYEFDYRMVAADGRPIWIHDIVHVQAENGAAKTLRGFMIDVTARRRAEEESRNLREQLARVGRASLMGQLAASIAHEVNQPLCAIVTNGQAIQRQLGTGKFDLPDVLEALRDIVQDGQRASAVIARTRGYLQKTVPQRAPLDLNDLIREVSVLLRGEMARRGIVVRLELADRLPLVIGERIPLQQVLVNLMTNGADAMDGVPRERCELVIGSAEDEAGTVRVAVKDAGTGLDVRNSGQLFDAFFTTKPGSMGMGLAICKSIVEDHGGKIGASPNATAGATFQFALPGMDPEAPP